MNPWVKQCPNCGYGINLEVDSAHTENFPYVQCPNCEGTVYVEYSGEYT